MLHLVLNMRVGIFLLLLFYMAHAWSARYDLHMDQDIVGALQEHEIDKTQTLMDVARYYNVGYEEMKRINPGVHIWMPKHNSKVRIPSRFILPQAKRQGIVINLAEMRLYFFPKKEAAVYTYPIGIGRSGWETPTASTKVVRKTLNPTWTPPQSIRFEHLEMEDPLPRVIKAGPQNPLGQFALRLGIPGYLIHGTNKPDGVGMRISHGCIRMYPEDISQLFDLVKVNTQVQIVNQPYKFGIEQGKLFLETHLAREEQDIQNFTPIVRALMSKTESADAKAIDKAVEVAKKNDGIPRYLSRLIKDDWYLELGLYEENITEEFQLYKTMLSAPIFHAEAKGKCRWLAGPFGKRKTAEAELERLRKKSQSDDLRLISLGEKKSCTPT